MSGVSLSKVTLLGGLEGGPVPKETTRKENVEQQRFSAKMSCLTDRDTLKSKTQTHVLAKSQDLEFHNGPFRWGCPHTVSM